VRGLYSEGGKTHPSYPGEMERSTGAVCHDDRESFDCGEILRNAGLLPKYDTSGKPAHQIGVRITFRNTVLTQGKGGKGRIRSA